MYYVIILFPNLVRLLLNFYVLWFYGTCMDKIFTLHNYEICLTNMQNHKYLVHLELCVNTISYLVTYLNNFSKLGQLFCSRFFMLSSLTFTKYNLYKYLKIWSCNYYTLQLLKLCSQGQSLMHTPTHPLNHRSVT